MRNLLKNNLNWDLLGNVSVFLAVLNFVLINLSFIITLSLAIFVTGSNNVSDAQIVSKAMLVGLPILIIGFSVIILNLVGVVFGLIGLFQSQQKKIGAIFGLLFNLALAYFVIQTIGGGIRAG